MNNYLIDPSIFYYISVINALHYLFWILGILSFVIGGATMPDIEFNKKMFITWLVITIVFILIGILLPSREVMYQMLASKIVTKDVAVKGLDYINNVVGQLLTR